MNYSCPSCRNPVTERRGTGNLEGVKVFWCQECRRYWTPGDMLWGMDPNPMSNIKIGEAAREEIERLKAVDAEAERLRTERLKEQVRELESELALDVIAERDQLRERIEAIESRLAKLEAICKGYLPEVWS